jgi:hypothetical protein
VNTFRPPITQYAIQRSPSKSKLGLIEIGAKLVDTRHPDHHWNRICNGAEEFLSLARRAFFLSAPCIVTAQVPASKGSQNLVP